MKKITKNMVAGVIVAAVVLSIGSTSAFAASGENSGNLIDADNNGVCDYAGNGPRYTDEDGDGVCDYAGNDCGYMDEDGDGVCDNRGTRRHGGSQRKGSGRDFVDADNDGICDNYAFGQRARQGKGTCGERNR